MKSLTQVATPDAEELRQKRAQLVLLEQELTEKELELSTSKGEQHIFQKRYNQRVGVKYAELDEVKARILELVARLFPEQGECREEADTAREQARRSAEETGEATVEPMDENRFKPSEDLKRLFREVAKKIHPDLATDPKEHERRHHFMALLNKAYDALDADKIRNILSEWEDGEPPDESLGLGVQLVKAIRKISQVRQRLEKIEEEIERLHNSEMFSLKERIEQAETEGVDLLNEMVLEIDEKIETLQSRVKRLAHEASQI